MPASGSFQLCLCEVEVSFYESRLNEQVLYKVQKIPQPLGCFSWAVRAECVKRALRHVDLWYVDTILSPLSRSIVIAWCDVAVMWTLRVLCAALEARRLWKSSMMPLCWSASPNWTHVFILSYHSQMVSTAPTELPGVLSNWVLRWITRDAWACSGACSSILGFQRTCRSARVRPSLFICKCF